MADPPERYPTLDGLRGVAALAVLVFHGGVALGCPWLVGHGALAVDLFFALSGIVVDRAYGPRLRAGWPRQAFATARVVRLYPLYLAATLLAVALQSVGWAWQGRAADIGGLALVALAGALLLPLPRGGDRQMFPLDPPCWSLLVEAVVNAGLAALPRRRPRLAAVIVVAAVVAAASVLLAAAFRAVPLLRGGAAGCAWVDVARGAFGFGCGLLISRAEGRGLLARLRGRWTSSATLALLGMLLMPRGVADLWLDPVGILLLCPATVVLAFAQPRCPDRLRGFCARAGSLSYPLYLVHAPLLKLAIDLTPPAGPDASAARAGAVWVALSASLALAAAAARFDGARRAARRNIASSLA